MAQRSKAKTKNDIRLVAVLGVGMAGMVGAYFLGRQHGGDAVGVEWQKRVLETALDGSVVGPGVLPDGSPAGGVVVGGASGGVVGGVVGGNLGSAGTVGDIDALLRDAASQVGEGFGNIGNMLKAFNLVYQLDDDQIREAVTMVEEWPPGAGRAMIEMALLSRWSETDPAGAAEHATEHSSGNQRFGALGSIAQNWALKDPEAALAWYAEVRDSPDSTPNIGFLLTGMFQAMASKDLGSALERFGQIEDSEERTQAFNGIASSAVADPGRLERLLAAVDGFDEEFEGSARSTVVERWSNFDPEGAAQWVGENLEDTSPEHRNQIVDAAINGWMQSDPKAAAAWAIAQADTPERAGELAQKVVQRWLWQNPNAAAEWLGQQKGGAELDGARNTLASNVAAKDPESAFIWASTIHNTEMRENAVHRAFRTWHEKSPAAAQDFLLASDIPEETAVKWLEEAGVGKDEAAQ